jgi:hypothetical protein
MSSLITSTGFAITGYIQRFTLSDGCTSRTCAATMVVNDNEYFFPENVLCVMAGSYYTPYDIYYSGCPDKTCSSSGLDQNFVINWEASLAGNAFNGQFLVAKCGVLPEV